MSTEKSYAVLIKKAMAKMPNTLNNKKSIDEYYKTAMKEIVVKMKAEEKATADAMKAKKAKAVVKGSKGKTVKKPKKVVGGMTDKEELEIIDNIFTKFISYNNRIMTEGSKYINNDSGSYRSDIKGICYELNKLFSENITISDEDITRSLGSYIYVNNIYDILDDRVTQLLQGFIYNKYRSEYDSYVNKYNAKYNNNTYWD